MKKIITLFLVILCATGFAQTTTYFTWPSIRTAYETWNTSKGIRNKSTSSYVFTNGAQTSAETIGNGEQLIFNMPIASANWVVALSSSSTVSPDYVYNEIGSPLTGNTSVNFGIFVGVSGNFIQVYEKGLLVGSPYAVSGTNGWVRINYVGSQIKYEYSTDRVSWSLVYTSTIAPSGQYYAVFQGLTANNGPGEIYKVGGSTQSAPTVSVSPSAQSITLPTSSTLIVGSASTSGTISSRSWVKISGPSGDAISTPSKDSTIVSGLTQGTFVYRYTATDNLGQSSSADVTVVVLPVGGTSSNVSFSLFTTSDPEVASSDRGSYEWMYQELINIPMANGLTIRPDFYYRNHVWAYLEPTQGNYDWNRFDADIKYAIDRGQTFSFGIMTLMPDGDLSTSVFNSGGYMAYPPYLHTLMQGEATKDWVSTMPGVNTWVPNFNSPNYISRWGALNRAIKNHLDTTFYKGVRFRDVINTVDVRGFGSWGQWNMSNIINDTTDYPAGTQPTASTLIKIMDSVALIFNNYRCVFNTEAIDARTFWNTWIDPAVGYHALTLQNNQGYMGIRLDAFGWFNITPNWMENNKGSYGGLNFATEAMNRWKIAPIKGEPGGPDRNGLADGYMSDLVRQTNFYHFNTMGNGNVDQPVNATLATNVNAAVKIMGYRLQIENGSIPSTATAGGSYSMTLNWRNAGVAPVYRKWYPVLELRTLSGTVVYRDTSVFEPKYFLPSTTTSSYTDTWAWPSNISNGTYTLHIILRDSCGYRSPLALCNKNRLSDGSYQLQTIVFGGAVNQPPIVNPITTKTVFLPASSVVISGSATDPDGTISSYLWTQVSGPNNATLSGTTTSTLTASGLIEGSYSFRLSVTDNSGATSSTTAIVVVSFVSVNAGSPQTITLPTSSTTLTATTIGLSSPTWSQVSGPSVASISTPNSMTTAVSGLVAGTYTFRVTMLLGASSYTSDVTVTVIQQHINTAPSVNAGVDQTITYPAQNYANLLAVGSDQDGFVSSYQWTQVSGPSTATILTPTTASTTVSGLVSGTYKFSVVAVDNESLASSPDTVQVVVQTASNLSPVANAGQSQTIYTSTTTLSGSGTDQDGTIVSFLWTKVSGSGGVIASPTSSVTSVSGLSVGTYVFRLTVTDNLGATNSATVTVVVTTSGTGWKYVKYVSTSWNTSVSPSRRVVTVIYTDNSKEVIEILPNSAYIITIRQGYSWVDGQRRIVVWIRFSDGSTRTITKVAI